MKILLAAMLLAVTTIGYNMVTPDLDDIYIPMSDGDSLQADVYIPTGVDSAEVILIQTPYNKDFFQITLPFGISTDPLLDAQSFIWVIVDWRGFYGSAGAQPQSDRGQDAYDVCDWIVAQNWHKDRIGTWGPSALGGIQYQLIEKNHPNHTCAVPQVATGWQDYTSYFYGGVLEEARLNQLDALGYGLSPTILANVYDNPIWAFSENSTWFADDIQIPTLQIGGWYDHHIDPMMDFYKASRNTAAVPVQDEQWLLVGPWVHGGTGAAYIGTSVQGELTYPNAALISDTMAWDFFEYYLLDAPNGWDATPMITYYEMGNDIWQSSNSDDIAASSSNILYLDQGEQLMSTVGVSSTTFVSDPQDPSPTIGGATLSDALDQGPYDQSSLDSRNDVITFSTGDLQQDVTITGRIQLDLYVSADQADCDIACRLVDVYPSGENMLITDGIKRMRFRNNAYQQTDEVFMTPGQIYNVQVDLPFTNYTWKAGHEIKIYLSGNHAIRFNVNLQDGGTMYQTGTGNVANITIHHNSTYPSQIELPGNNPFLGMSAESNVDFKLYPNPANDLLNINSKEVFTAYQILDITGKVITDFNPMKDNQVGIQDLESGTYILKLKRANGNCEQQIFVKQ